VGNGQPVHIAEYSRWAFLVRVDVERLEFGDELIGFGCGEQSPVLCARKHGARFVEPEHGDKRVVAGCQLFQNGIGLGMRRAFETPSHGDGIVENERHARP